MSRGILICGLVSLLTISVAQGNKVPTLFLPDLGGIIGPKNNPGETIDSVDRTDVNRALDEVSKAAGATTRRAIAVGISNVAGLTLTNPIVYLDAGTSAADAVPEVPAEKTGLQLYTSSVLSGSTDGLLTYDLEGTDYKVAVMWKVPFTMTFSDILYNAKVYPKSYATGVHMFEQMENYAGAWKPSGWESREELGVQLSVTITSNLSSKLLLSVDSTAFDSEGALESNIACAYNAKWFGKYCWRECHSGGWCWVDLKCGGAADCQGPHPCYAYCQDTP